MNLKVLLALLLGGAILTMAKMEVGIIGGYESYALMNPPYSDLRVALGAKVTRHEFSFQAPVIAQEAVILHAAKVLKTRIHALINNEKQVITDRNQFANFVVNFIKRYGVDGSFWREHKELDGKRYAIRTFELLNEPYYGHMSGPNYARAIRPALERVKRLKLKAKMVPAGYVLGPQLCPKKKLECVEWKGSAWVQALYVLIPKLNTLIDGIALHPYRDGFAPNGDRKEEASPFTRMARLRRVMNKYGGSKKGIYITEYGVHTAASHKARVTEAQQANYLKIFLKAAKSSKSWKVRQFIVYHLHDLNNNAADPYANYGIVRADLSKKPAWNVVKSFV
jgi:hypothetical protein